MPAAEDLACQRSTGQHSTAQHNAAAQCIISAKQAASQQEAHVPAPICNRPSALQSGQAKPSWSTTLDTEFAQHGTPMTCARQVHGPCVVFAYLHMCFSDIKPHLTRLAVLLAGADQGRLSQQSAPPPRQRLGLRQLSSHTQAAAEAGQTAKNHSGPDGCLGPQLALWAWALGPHMACGAWLGACTASPCAGSNHVSSCTAW